MKQEKKRILIVEDSPVDVGLIVGTFRKKSPDVEITVARDGQEALEYFINRPEDALPSVILLDLGLPKISGLQVLEHLRKDPKLTHIPVVILTGSREEMNIAKSQQLNVEAYLVKPISVADIVDAIGCFVGPMHD